MRQKFPELKSKVKLILMLNETKLKSKVKVTTKANKSKTSPEIKETKTVQTSVSKKMRKKQTLLADQFQKFKQCRKRRSSLCYGKDDRCFMETNNVHSLTSEPGLRKFLNGYNNMICCIIFPTI